MKAAILGGSFNPPHIGHLALAEQARIQLGYDIIYWIPTFISPFKPECLVSSDDRLAMVRLAIAGNPHFVLDSCEIERGGVSYTVDTVRYLYNKFSGNAVCALEGRLGLIIGDDLIRDFHLWREADVLPDITDIILAHRIFPMPDMDKINTPIQRVYSGAPFKHVLLENAVLPVSSTDIRSRIRQNASWRYLVPQTVYEYINTRHLYAK